MKITYRKLAIAVRTKRWSQNTQRVQSQNTQRMQSKKKQCKIPAENFRKTCGKLIITNAHLEAVHDICRSPKRRQPQQTASYKIRCRRCARRMAHRDILVSKSLLWEFEGAEYLQTTTDTKMFACTLTFLSLEREYCLLQLRSDPMPPQ